MMLSSRADVVVALDYMYISLYSLEVSNSTGHLRTGSAVGEH